MREPTQLCASCKHTLAEHFWTVQGNRGCHNRHTHRQWYSNTDYDDLELLCYCPGFSEIIQWNYIHDSV